MIGKLYITIAFIISGLSCFGQTQTEIPLFDTTALSAPSIFSSGNWERYFGGDLEPHPSQSDIKNFDKYKHLTKQNPTSKNYKNYFSLACSLWDLSKLDSAKSMFLKIINSKEKFYSNTYYNASDIPADTSTNTYGYGSFTFNYKNQSALYLCKIDIVKKQYQQALQYLEDASNKYKVVANCGTRYRFKKDESDYLYAKCYEGLNMNQELVDLLLPECLNRNDTLIIKALKNLYTPQQITQLLNEAEKSVDCILYTEPSHTYTTENNKETIISTYYSGRATLKLFNQVIDIPTPELKDGERIRKENFINEFKNSSFYLALIN